MLKYRSQLSSATLSAAPQALAQRAPATPLKSSKLRKSSHSKAVSRYQLDTDIRDELLNNVDTLPQQARETVQEEFDKYANAKRSPLETDILHFWEVSNTYINEDNDADWNNTDQQGGVSNVVRNCPGLSSDSGIFCSMRASFFVGQEN
jgi:hypothetical protein